MINILRCYTRRLQVTPVITIFHRPYIKVSNKMEMLLKQADKIPQNFELIYRYPTYRMAGFMFHTVNFSALTTCVILAYAWYTKQSLNDNKQLPKFIENPVHTITMCCGAAIVICIAWIIRGKHPMRIYYNAVDGVYKAIFIGKMPFSVECYEFQKGSMSYVCPDSTLPWQSALFQTNGRKILLHDEFFRTQADLVNMFTSEKE